MKREVAAALVTLALFAFGVPSDAAAPLQIKPSAITLESPRAVGQLTMRSLDARDLVFDLQVQQWSQHGEADSFAPTNELIVAPPVFDIAPFGTVLVRVALRDPATAAANEVAFHVRFREVQPGNAQTEARVLTVTVFSPPAYRHGEIAYTLHRVEANRVALVVANGSNAHVYLGAIRLEAGGRQLYARVLDAYVLGGNTRSFSLTLSEAMEANSATLTVVGEQGAKTVDVPVR